MLFAKRSVFDQKLSIVACEVLVDGDFSKEDILSEEQQTTFIDFITTLLAEVNQSTTTFRLIIPYQLEKYTESLSEEQRSTLCFKIKVTQQSPLNQAIRNDHQKRTTCYDVDALNSLSDIGVTNDFVIVNAGELITDTSKTHKLSKAFPTIIAKQVDDYQTLDTLAQAGVHHYTGHFIEKPTTQSQEEIAPNKTSVLTLISKLNDPDVTTTEVSSILAADNILSYKLLKIVNSPLFRGMSEIQSVQDAIVRFGYTNLKKWVLMLSLCDLGDKPSALIKLALQRAIMCSKAAEEFNLTAGSIDTCYTAGLLSTLDAFLDHPMEALLNDLALSDELANAILHFSGDVGDTLQQVIMYQRGELKTNSEAMTEIYIMSSKEATDAFRVLGMD